MLSPTSRRTGHGGPCLAFCLVLLGTSPRNAGASPSPSSPPSPPGGPPTTVTRVSPAAGATGVCPDSPLRIEFSAPASLGNSGRIHVVDAANNAVIETIDVSAGTATQTIGGLAGFNYRPVIVSDREAAIYPRNGALGYGKTYVVTVDAGVFTDRVAAPGAAARGIAGPASWRFTTRAASPARGVNRLTVSADGTADFCTVEGALDFIPDGNTTPTTIFLRKGTYTEIVFFTHKHGITLIGEDRRQTIITYANNDRFNHSPGNPYAPEARDTRPSSGRNGPFVPNPSDAVIGRGDAIYRRAVFMAHRANDLVVASLTIRNTTPTGGSQAETIILNGTPTARAILKDLDLTSTQDTLQINGQAYVSNCTIEGDVDFIWGRGPCFFENCVCRALRSDAFYTQIRNPDTNHGFVFVRCRFDGVPGAIGNYLSRIKTARFPDSEVVLIDCVLGSAVHPVAWQLQDNVSGAGGGGAGGGGASAGGGGVRVHFWEWRSHDIAGKPVPVGARLGQSRQLTLPRDAVVIASYSDPTFVLGNGWRPGAAAIFVRGRDGAAIERR